MSKILGVKIDEYSFLEVMQKITIFLNSKSFHQIVTVNPEFIVAAQADKEFLNILNEADLSVVDGFGLKFAALITRKKIGERITGVDLTWELAKLAERTNYSIFLLGAGVGVAEKTAKRLKTLYPKLKIAGTYSGGPNDKKTYEALKKAKPDILLVAFGAPKQDKFIYELKSHYSDLGFRISDLPKVAMGVGGTFDYIAGVIPRAPLWMRSLGFEWLYRTFRQPSRLSRIYDAIIKFPLLVLFKHS